MPKHANNFGVALMSLERALSTNERVILRYFIDLIYKRIIIMSISSPARSYTHYELGQSFYNSDILSVRGGTYFADVILVFI